MSTPETGQSFFETLLAQSPYAQLLGVEMKVEGDALRFNLPFQPHNIGNDHMPALHGGVIGGFMETAGILHLLWIRESTDIPRIVDFSIDYLRPGKGRELYAECSVTKHGKRIANVLVTAWQEDREKPVAVARAHYLLSE